MKFGTCGKDGSMILTRGDLGISIEYNPSQKMLSYLIAVEVENLIESQVELETANFDLNLMMKDMEEAATAVNLTDTR